jgi:flagellar basal-body rod protein FlgG
MPSIHSLVASMQAQWSRHELLANNLANLSTPGFKQDDLALVPAPAAGASAPGASLSPLGGHALVQWTSFAQGPIRETGRPLDVALNGSGFLVVETPAGPRYTRAGALTLGRDGSLVTAAGFPVLGRRGPIVAGSDGVTITPRGEVQRDGALLDTLRVVDFPKPYQLLKEGNGLFVAADPSASPTPARETEVVAGALEGANVGAVETMVNMIQLFRTYEAAQRAIQAADETDRRATSEIGRV